MDEQLIRYASECNLNMIESLLYFYNFDFPILLKAYQLTYCRGIKLKSNSNVKKMNVLTLRDQGEIALLCGAYIYEKLEIFLTYQKNIQKLAKILCSTNFTSFHQFSCIYNLNYNTRYKNKNLFHIACEHGNVDIINYILTKNIKINKQTLYKGKYDKTALHIAVQNHDLDVINILLNHGCNRNILDIKQQPALLYVAPGSTGNMKIFELLVMHGADINFKYNDKTLLYQAVDDNRVETVKYLLSLGASPFIPSLYKENNSIYHYSYEIPLDLAKKKKYKCVMQQNNNQEIINILKNEYIKLFVSNNYIY